MKNAALAALAALAAVSVHAETVWVGNAFVTAATAACGPATAGAFAAVGDFYRVVYRPAGVPLGNAADSYFAIIGQRSNFTMLVPNNTFRSGINYASRYVTSQVNFGTNGASILAWSMTPAALDASVKNASLTFTFANFFAVAGCTQRYAPTWRLRSSRGGSVAIKGLRLSKTAESAAAQKARE